MLYSKILASLGPENDRAVEGTCPRHRQARNCKDLLGRCNFPEHSNMCQNRQFFYARMQTLSSVRERDLVW